MPTKSDHSQKKNINATNPPKHKTVINCQHCGIWIKSTELYRRPHDAVMREACINLPEI